MKEVRAVERERKKPRKAVKLPFQFALLCPENIIIPGAATPAAHLMGASGDSQVEEL